VYCSHHSTWMALSTAKPERFAHSNLWRFPSKVASCPTPFRPVLTKHEKTFVCFRNLETCRKTRIQPIGQSLSSIHHQPVLLQLPSTGLHICFLHSILKDRARINHWLLVDLALAHSENHTHFWMKEHRLFTKTVLDVDRLLLRVLSLIQQGTSKTNSSIGCCHQRPKLAYLI